MQNVATSMNPRRIMTGLVAAALLCAVAVQAAPISYSAILSGAAEAPPNASPGTGQTFITVDPVAHTMRVQVVFSGLMGTVTACHIHGPTATPGTGTAGVATVLPTFTGFPSGVTAGTYDNTFDMTLASSYNAAFITNNGGTTATAEAALFAAIDAGRTYLNLHSSVFGGGELRGFLTPDNSTPTDQTTWGRIKSLYR